MSKSQRTIEKQCFLFAVSKVKWAPDLPDGEMNFFSVAADGKINNWILMQNELSVTTITVLYLEKDPVPGPDGTFVRVKGNFRFCTNVFVSYSKSFL